jgi:hypothetical protein
MVVFFEQLITKSEFHSLCTICLRSTRLLFQENQIEINLLKKTYLIMDFLTKSSMQLLNAETIVY